MQLSKLEIKGFKSFADKVIINFDEGITGIVGPNGCGKSNVVDSIRWVLGEQKTSVLRSEKMENIIFNGTSARSSQQMAEVSLTIDNTKNILPTEYSQVTITRRLYRTGESEYLLNGVSCRLKDISNLFLDTGVASNSYAIIELGMVDDLLNDRDNSRRTLFEEAAGISKFKKRKKETLKKMEDADADLERVADLLFEIEKNMKTLEKQAKQTEQFYKLKEHYKEKSIRLAHAVGKKQREKFASLTAQLDAETNVKTQLIAASAEIEARLEKAKTELVMMERTLSERQKNINDFAALIRQAESEKQLKQERLRYLKDRIVALKNQLEQDQTAREETQKSVSVLEAERAAAQQALQEISGTLENLKAAYEEQKTTTSEVQQKLDALRKEHRQYQETSYQLNKDIEIRTIQIASLQQESERASSDTHKQTESLAEFEKKLTVLQEEIQTRQQQLDEVKGREKEMSELATQSEKEIEKIREQLTDRSRQLDARNNEYQLTKSLVENLEGFPEAIRFLKKHVGWAKNAPLLSDVITTAEEYRIAIENYLEPFLNYYIVEHEAEAYQAINILSDAGQGKANFFILDSFKNNPLPHKEYADAFPALQLMEFDEQYSNLMRHLLGNVYFFEGDFKNLPEAEDDAFISKSGRVTRRRYSLSGGSVGLFEGKKIGRVKNLEKLDGEIKTLSKNVEDIRQQLFEKQRELERLRSNTLKNDIEEAQLKVKLVNDEFISIRAKRDQFAQMLDTAGLRREDILAKIAALTAEITALKPQAELALGHLAGREDEVKKWSDELAINNDLLSQKSAAYNEQHILFHQQENRGKSTEQEIRHKEEFLRQSNARIESNTAELQKNEEEMALCHQAIEEADGRLISMYEKKEELTQGLNEAEKAYYAGREQIDGMEKEIKEAQRRREDVDALLLNLHEQLNESKMQLNSVKERLSVEFNIELENMTPEEGEPEEEDKLRGEVNKLREKVESMRDVVNPGAMEAFHEIKQRNDFINAQRDDLMKAKESLDATITEIESVASETFMDAFNRIKEHFIHVFRTLFNEGDDCDLKLLDPTRPLESDIDIIAKPKGKRPLTINQLSGGEKTLTATALLFSMYLLKPAPFCIFDEVDAPLDDANIDKFNSIIRNFSKESQFVIVTHNKRTMSTTDVIYGVTMAEKGVSRVVPVDLRQLA